MASGIYEIRNTLNGKRYIGSAVEFGNRWRVHAQSLQRGDHHSRQLQRAWRKYTPAAFQFNKILECAPEHLLMYEQRLIDGLKPEYNTNPTAGSMLGFKHSEESRAKMQESRMAYDFSYWRGKTRSEETKAKIRATKTGVKHGKYDAERIAKTAAAMRAGKGALTEEQVRLIRKWNAEGQPHKHSAALIGCSYWVVADVVRNRTFTWVK